jgi:hypothetical protein
MTQTRIINTKVRPAIWDVFDRLRKRHGRTVQAELEAALCAYYRAQKMPYKFPDEDEVPPIEKGE